MHDVAEGLIEGFIEVFRLWFWALGLFAESLRWGISTGGQGCAARRPIAVAVVPKCLLPGRCVPLAASGER